MAGWLIQPPKHDGRMGSQGLPPSPGHPREKGNPYLTHNKVVIIDEATLITGSFNFTKAAEERNAENVLVIRGDDVLVKKYLANFGEHLGHSEKYEGRN
jgi:phosphatidylserine/phosphatidylglycerophosphate/cardiolipin synthase-like enzyme